MQALTKWNHVLISQFNLHCLCQFLETNSTKNQNTDFNSYDLKQLFEKEHS